MSSRMPAGNGKTVSARRNVILAGLVVVILAAGVAAYIYGSSNRHYEGDGHNHSAEDLPTEKTLPEESQGPSPEDFTYKTLPIIAGNKTLTIQLADTADKRSLGLGKRDSIDGGVAGVQGMLFPYGKVQQLCFWMKDMRINIDMLWLDADKRVIKIEPKVSMASYPDNYCADAQYVLELDSGDAARQGIKVGDQLTFNL